MKLNKYALVLFLGLGTLTSCNDNLELLNPNQQTSNTFGFNADDLEESVIAAYNHIRMEGSYARVGYTIDVCRGDEAWNSSQVWYLPFDDLNAEVTSDITWWPWREWYYTKWKVISKKPWNCYPHEIKVANGKKDVPPVVPQPVTMPVRSWYAINSKTPLLY